MAEVYAQLPLLSTHKTCSFCGESKLLAEYYRAPSSRDGLRGECKRCILTKQAAYLADNPEVDREYQRRYREQNRERLLEKAKEYHRAHRESALEKNRARYQANKDAHAASVRIWQAANAERVREIKRASRARRREEENARRKERRAADIDASRLQGRIYAGVRRARQIGNGGSHTATDIHTLYERQHAGCYWCFRSLDGQFEVDHVIPLSRGGGDGKDNIVLACQACNRSRGNKLPSEWQPLEAKR